MAVQLMFWADMSGCIMFLDKVERMHHVFRLSWKVLRKGSLSHTHFQCWGFSYQKQPISTQLWLDKSWCALGSYRLLVMKNLLHTFLKSCLLFFNSLWSSSPFETGGSPVNAGSIVYKHELCRHSDHGPSAVDALLGCVLKPEPSANICQQTIRVLGILGAIVPYRRKVGSRILYLIVWRLINYWVGEVKQRYYPWDAHQGSECCYSQSCNGIIWVRWLPPDGGLWCFIGNHEG